MNKADLVSSIAEKTELSKKDSEKALNSLLEVISEALARKEKVKIAGLGTFEVTERTARLGKNPKTGEDIQIPATVVPKFKASADFKRLVKESNE
jgi:DNA-binding protein HU-beta